MVKLDKIREKLIIIKSKVKEDECPMCKEKSVTPVFPFGSDTFFCCYPLCLVTRFDSNGYYLETDEPIQTPNVQYIGFGMKNKR